MAMIYEFIKHVLLEAKVDQVAERYPEISELILSYFGDMKTKYLDWSAKMLSQDPREETADVLTKLTTQFDALASKNRIKEKDINRYDSIEQLHQAVTQKESEVVQKQQKKSEIKSGAITVFENEDYLILIPKTKAASCYYGKGTSWCIAYTDPKTPNQFEKYMNRGEAFIFVLPKHGSEKLAAVVEHGKIREAFTQNDTKISANAFFETVPEEYHQVILDAAPIATKAQEEFHQKKLEKFEKIKKQIEAEDNEYEVEIDGGYNVSVRKNGELHREDGPAVIFASGTKSWYQNGKRHREGGPAIIKTDGSKSWYQNGELQRDDGPAITKADGTQYWYQNGEYHRDNGPAQIDSDGVQLWYQNGKLHRDDGPAIIYPNGMQEWWKNGELHRDDGPAVIHASGNKFWYQNGRRHREDGPAIVFANGKQYWYQNGKFIK